MDTFLLTSECYFWELYTSLVQSINLRHSKLFCWRSGYHAGLLRGSVMNRPALVCKVGNGHSSDYF